MSSFFKVCLLALTIAPSVLAQTSGFDVFTNPLTPGLTFAAGEKMHITWTPSEPAGKISILLLEGATNTSLVLDPTPVASAIDSVSGAFDWLIPTTLKSFPLYGFKLQLDSDPTVFQYSTFFSISGLGSTTDSSSVATSTTTVKISKVSDTTTTITSTSTPVNSTITTATPVYSNTTMSTAAGTGAGTGTGTGKPTTAATTSASTATSTSGAMANAAVGGTSLLGAILLGFGMML